MFGNVFSPVWFFDFFILVIFLKHNVKKEGKMQLFFVYSKLI